MAIFNSYVKLPKSKYDIPMMCQSPVIWFPHSWVNPKDRSTAWSELSHCETCSRNDFGPRPASHGPEMKHFTVFFPIKKCEFEQATSNFDVFLHDISGFNQPQLEGNIYIYILTYNKLIFNRLLYAYYIYTCLLNQHQGWFHVMFGY